MSELWEGDARIISKAIEYARRFQPYLLTIFAFWYAVYLFFSISQEGSDWNAVSIAWSKHGNFLAWTAYPIGLLFMVQTRKIKTEFWMTFDLLAKRRVIVWLSDVSHGVEADIDCTKKIFWRNGVAREQRKNMEWTATVSGVVVSFVLLILVGMLIVTGTSAQFDLIFSNGDTNPSAFKQYLTILIGFHLPMAGILCLICGHRMGRVAYYGYATFRHQKFSIYPSPKLGHEDRVLGLNPLGRFFIGVAKKFSGLSLFFISWLICFAWAFNFGGPQNFMMEYAYLFTPFGILALVVLALQATAAFLPLWTVHTRLVELKKVLLNESAKRSRNRNKLYCLFFKGDTSNGTKRRIEINDTWLMAYDAIPTWPLEKGTFQNFWILWGSALTSVMLTIVSLHWKK